MFLFIYAKNNNESPSVMTPKHLQNTFNEILFSHMGIHSLVIRVLLNKSADA